MRTVVALFDHFEDAQNAINALNSEGYQRENLNLIANDVNGQYARSLGLDPNRQMDVEVHDTNTGDGAATGAGIGAVLGGIGGLLLGLGALAIPGVGPVLAAGPIVSALAGAGIGAVAGGLVGALVDLGIPEEHAHYYAEGVRRGGSLVTVRVEDQHADHVRDLLNRYNPVDIETRARTWRDRENWTRYDPNAEPMSHDRMEFNRSATMPVTGGDMDSDFGQTGRGMTSSAYDRGEGTAVDSTLRDDDEVIDRMDDHLRDDVFGAERGGLPNADIPRTGGGMGTPDMDVTAADWDTFDTAFRSDYQTRFGVAGQGYDYYQPAYRYGYDLAMDPRYRDYDWDRIEMDARRDWEMRGVQTAWDDVKDAVRHAWRSVTGRW